MEQLTQVDPEQAIEALIQAFGDDPVAAHNYRCEMVARAIKAIGDSTKHGECWVYPNTDDEGYGITSVLGKKVTASRLVQCCATGKPLDYHNEEGKFMEAGHKTPLCRFRACLNPEHLHWVTKRENAERRELERRARAEAARLVAEGFAPAEAATGHHYV